MRVASLVTALVVLTACFFPGCDARRGAKPAAAKVPATAPAGATEMEVEAACWECKFGMTGDGCDLAVRIDGKSYYIDGTGLDDHGDAHAADGFCNAIRRAKVSGRVEGDRFVATSFQLLPKS